MTDEVVKIPRTIRGEVISVSSNKTATLRVDRRVKHPIYGKYIKRSSKFHIHDENNECQVGDLASAIECRPISKTKSFRLKSIDVKTERV